MMKTSQSLKSGLDFQTIFELTPGSCLVLAPDENFTIIAVNGAYLDDTKTKRENIIGKGFFEIFPEPTETTTKNLRAFLKQVLQDKIPNTMAVQKYVHGAEAGRREEQYWSLTNTPILGINRVVNFIIHRTENITEVMQLKLKKQRAEILQKGIDLVEGYAIILLDKEGHVTSWNKGAEQTEGYSSEEIIGQSFTEFYPLEAIQKAYPEHELSIARERGHFEDEGWRVRKDGSRFLANVIITPTYDEKHEHIGFMKIIRDLTEQKKAKLQTKILQKAIDFVEDYAIILLDKDGCVTSWNKGAKQTKGYSSKEIIGQSFKKFYPLEAIQKAYPEHELKIAKEEGRFEDDGWRVRKDGSRFWANIIITPTYDEKNEHIGFMKITRDLTERKKVELYALTEQSILASAAEEHRKKQEEFVDTICHEIRNPLNGIYGGIELLQDTIISLGELFKKNHQLEILAGTEFNEMLGKAEIEAKLISECVKQQKIIVDDVLSLSKLENNKLELNPAPFELRQFIKNVLQIFTLQLEQKKLTLILNIPEVSYMVKGRSPSVVANSN